MDPSLKNCKKIRNLIIGLEFFPLESENSLLCVKKLQLSQLFHFSSTDYKWKAFFIVSTLGKLGKKLQNEPAKVWVRKMFENDVLNNILKPPLPPPGAFFEMFLPLMNLKISSLRISSSTCIFGKKVSSKSCSLLNFLSVSTIIFQSRPNG